MTSLSVNWGCDKSVALRHFVPDYTIEKNDWTALQDYEELKGDGKLSPEILEQLFLESPKDAFAIYQLKRGEEYRDY